VVIDGVFGVSPTGWTSRSDLSALFPPLTYPGVTNALGVHSFDTTKLADGVHTIAWVVTADNGQADGIGSRYFTVANGSGVAAAVTTESTPALLAGSEPAVPAPATPLARRGFDETMPLQPLEADAEGRFVLFGEELDRFELHLGGAGYQGYMRAGDSLGPLPIGSSLDPATGVFTWSPGVGFVRNYDLVFIRPDGRRDVRFVLNPKGSTRVGPQVVIDTPKANAEVERSFVVGGWAIDLDDRAGTGVDTLHVWAYPVGGGDPLFLGATSYGGSRPDVGAIFGDRFAKSGYALTVDSLPAGRYDLAVFAWSTAQGSFVPAKVVRVTLK
jgi:hypothetical protein